jgi:hypothetical protein
MLLPQYMKHAPGGEQRLSRLKMQNRALPCNAVKDFFGGKICKLRGSCRRRRNFGAWRTLQIPQFTAKNPSRRCLFGVKGQGKTLPELAGQRSSWSCRSESMAARTARVWRLWCLSAASKRAVRAAASCSKPRRVSVSAITSARLQVSGGVARPVRQAFLGLPTLGQASMSANGIPIAAVCRQFSYVCQPVRTGAAKRRGRLTPMDKGMSHHPCHANWMSARLRVEPSPNVGLLIS